MCLHAFFKWASFIQDVLKCWKPQTKTTEIAGAGSITPYKANKELKYENPWVVQRNKSPLWPSHFKMHHVCFASQTNESFQHESTASCILFGFAIDLYSFPHSYMTTSLHLILSLFLCYTLTFLIIKLLVKFGSTRFQWIYSTTTQLHHQHWQKEINMSVISHSHVNYCSNIGT